MSAHLWDIFGTTLGCSSCIAFWTMSPLPHSLQDCVASLQLYFASHILGSKQPFAKFLSSAAYLPFVGLLLCSLGWMPFAHGISLLCRTRAAGSADQNEGVVMFIKASLMYFSISLKQTLSQRTEVCLWLVKRWQMVFVKILGSFFCTT